MSQKHPVHRVSFRDSDHSYFLEGKRVPSVTTILGNLSKPGLHFWSAKEGAKAVQSRILELHEDGTFPDSSDQVDGWIDRMADELYELARTAHMQRANAAAGKGNIVHDAVQKYHDDFFAMEPPDADEDPAARAAWDAFLAWWQDAGLRIIDSERKVVGGDGAFAGRLDMLCEDADERLHVCDIKTSNNVYVTHVMQNAAYAYAVEGELEREVASTKVIWLPAGCDYATIIERDRDEWRVDWEMFEMLVAVHGYRKGMSAWIEEVVQQHSPIPF